VSFSANCRFLASQSIFHCSFHNWVSSKYMFHPVYLFFLLYSPWIFLPYFGPIPRTLTVHVLILSNVKSFLSQTLRIGTTIIVLQKILVVLSFHTCCEVRSMTGVHAIYTDGINLWRASCDIKLLLLFTPETSRERTRSNAWCELFQVWSSIRSCDGWEAWLRHRSEHTVQRKNRKQQYEEVEHTNGLVSGRK